MTAGEDTSWLDGPEPADDWLDIEDPNANRTPAAFRALVEACMAGTERRMANAGNYLAYRPYNPRTEKEVNPRTRERFENFISAGEVKHLGTYDDVQIWEFQPGSPYYHQGNKAYIVGLNYWNDVRQAARLACERKWAEYHDFLEAMAVAVKGGAPRAPDGSIDRGFGATMWADTLNQVLAQVERIRQADKGAPTDGEINAGFVGVRRARGIQSNHGAVLLNSATLERVAF